MIKEALDVLRKGGIILYPTDTIWGIGCDATNPEAVERVYAIKRRSDSKSLVMLASGPDMVARYVERIPDIAIDLLEVNDAPMTIVYPGARAGKQGVSGSHLLAWNAVAEDGTAGIRVPLGGFCKDLCARFGRPIVSTSANISGEPSPKSFADIPDEIKKAVDYIVDPSLGPSSSGKASQIIKVGLDGEVKIIRM